MAEPLEEAAQHLVVAIFRLAVCDLSGLSYNHEADGSRPLRHRRPALDALLFLTGTWARELGELACIPMDAVLGEARRLAIAATEPTVARSVSWCHVAKEDDAAAD